jgi:uncharacterized protein (UPF0147 family)
MCNCKKLINQYKEKIAKKEIAIKEIIEMIRIARDVRKFHSYVIEDLTQQKLNAQRDRQHWLQFIEDLEDL